MNKQTKVLVISAGILILIVLGMFINIEFIAKGKFLKHGGFSRDDISYKLKSSYKYSIYSKNIEYLGTFDSKNYFFDYVNKNIFITMIHSNNITTVPIIDMKPKSTELDERTGKLTVFSEQLRMMFLLNAKNQKIEQQVALPHTFLRASRLNNAIVLIESINFKPFIKVYKFNNAGNIKLSNKLYSFKGNSLEEDGLLKNNSLDHFIFISSFKNKMMAIDTFGITYQQKTIDTIATGPKSKVITSEGYTYMTYAQPPRVTNENLQFTDKYTIVTSAVKSNELIQNEHVLVLDKYDTRGKYINSLPVDYSQIHGGSKPQSIFIHDDLLSLIYNDGILTFIVSNS